MCPAASSHWLKRLMENKAANKAGDQHAGISVSRLTQHGQDRDACRHQDTQSPQTHGKGSALASVTWRTYRDEEAWLPIVLYFLHQRVRSLIGCISMVWTLTSVHWGSVPQMLYDLFSVVVDCHLSLVVDRHLGVFSCQHVADAQLWLPSC